MAEEQKNYIDMSDEDFAKEPVPVVPEEDDDTNTLEGKPEDNASAEDEPEDGGDTEAGEESDADEDDPAKSEEDVDDNEPGTEDGAGKGKEEEEEDAETDEPKKEDEIDYKAIYKKVMTFKADGKDFSPKSVDDLIRLAQMGVNYHGKMAGLKPARTALKTLEKNGLLTDDKLNFLIEVNNGNPDAINKLLKEHKIDPLDVDVKTESTYRPDDHSASESEIELEETLSEIEKSPNYKRTLDTVSKEWDTASRNVAVSSPQIIALINEQMDSGVYDKINQAVNYERSLGGLIGINSFDAYKMMGDKLMREGALDPVNAESDQKTDIKPKAKVDPNKEAQRLKKKKAASPTKASKDVVGKLPKDFNPLNLSNEDFEKFDKKLIGL